MKKYITIFIILLICIIAIISNFVDDRLDGKTIAFLGDSLIQGHGNDSKSFEYYFSESLPNSKIINNSRSGCTITDNTGTDDIVLINQAKNLKGNPDIIVFNGGANDIISYGLGFIDNSLKKEIGVVDENPNAISDQNTVIGDLEEVIVELQNRFPEAKLCYLQMFLIDDETIDVITLDGSVKPEMKERRDKLEEQIKVLCKKRNVNYIDVADKFEGKGTIYRQNDGIHLKEEGYQLISHYILEKLEEIV
ncbi:MAG: SGNH/GDSL hydrolase family protein [Clostridia bacterium]|nr:SGNH/GDSL hydrolase family protein [Clostridia bacterium]